MQSDQTTHNAPGLAADARRYVQEREAMIKTITIIGFLSLFIAFNSYADDIALFQEYNATKRVRMDIYAEVERLSEEMLDIYKEKFTADINRAYYHTMCINTRTKWTETNLNRHEDFYLEKAQLETQENVAKREENDILIEESLLRLDAVKRFFSESLTGIKTNFKETDQIKKSIIALKLFGPHWIGFPRVNNSVVNNHTKLVEWKEGSLIKMNQYIEMKYEKPRKELLNGLKNQY